MAPVSSFSLQLLEFKQKRGSQTESSARTVTGTQEDAVASDELSTVPTPVIPTDDASQTGADTASEPVYGAGAGLPEADSPVDGQQQIPLFPPSLAYPPVMTTPADLEFAPAPPFAAQPTAAGQRYVSSAMVNADCYCSACGRICHGSQCMSGRCGHLARLKDRCQRRCWGYCNYFCERPLGESVISAMTAQIAHGTADLMTLYRYDFYPLDSPLGGELTPRGAYQLRKILDRVQLTSAPIKVQATPEHPEVDTIRVQAVAEQLHAWGVEITTDQIVVIDVMDGIPAPEAQEIYRTLLEDVRLRGRTISDDESTGSRFGGFGGSGGFGGFSRD